MRLGKVAVLGVVAGAVTIGLATPAMAESGDVIVRPGSVRPGDQVTVVGKKCQVDGTAGSLAFKGGAVPLNGAFEAGWYDGGPTPGERGPAVILGHVDTAKGAAVFYDLGRLRPGDRVEVNRADGRVAVFTVESVERVAKDRFPTRRVYGPIGHAGLRMVTCGGSFDRTKRSYQDNIIVYAAQTSVS